MTADTILHTQQRSAGRFFNNNEAQVDILAPPAQLTPVAPLAPEKLYITSVNTDGFGQWTEYELPFGYLGDVYISAALGALSSGNYTTYPGLVLIDEVELRSGSNILQSFRYRPVVRALMSKMDNKAVSLLQTVSGGASFASGNVVCPIPLFWTRFGTAFNDNPTPLNTHLASTKLKLRVKFQSAANVSDAGATTGSPTISTKLYYYNFHTESGLRASHIDGKEDYVYPGSDWQTLPQSASTAAGSAATLDASSFYGSLAEIYVSNTLVSNVDTAKDYLLDEGDIDTIKLQIDGRDYWVSEQEESIEYDNLVLAENRGATGTFGDPVVIPFGIAYDHHHYSGSLHMDSVNKMSVIVNHSSGAACYFDISARVHAHWMLSGGNFVRMN